jgi:hypothetical protein
MQEVPKIVRERLRTAKAAVNHPDADLLAAYAEKSLPVVDRGIVLEHLARCGDCREIVALALPPVEEAQAAVVIVPARGWLSWPVLRWGLVAAGVVVASVGLIEYQHGARHSLEAARTSSGSAAIEAKNAQPLSVTPAPAQEAEKHTASAPRNPVPAFASNRVGQGAGANRADKATGVVTLDAQNSAPVPTMAMRYRAPMPSAPHPFAATAHAADSSTQPATAEPSTAYTTIEGASEAPSLQRETAVAQNQPPTELPPAKPNDMKVDRAKALVVDQNVGSPLYEKSSQDVPVNGRNAASSDTTLSPPTWRIDASGNLDRSLDQGKTWQSIDASSLPNPGIPVGGAPPNVRTNVVRRPEPIVFRAVTANGPDVWAGGLNAALYHSSDGGNHWTRVSPSSSGVTLSGDVIQLNFPDAQHGTVTTSTSERWTTLDGGQSWQKQ